MTGASRPLWSVLKSRDQFGASELPLLTVVSDFGVRVRDLAEGRAPSEDLSGYRVVRLGDLVVNRLWARFGAYGVSGVDGMISPAYWVLQIDQERYEPRFIHHLLRSSVYRAEIWRRSKDMPPNGFDLPWEHFRTIRVPELNLQTQRAIADYLDAETARIDWLLSQRHGQVALLREAVEARRSSTILSGLDPVTGGGRIPDTWDRPLLGVLIELHRGIDLPSDDRKPGEIPVVSSGGIGGTHSVAACHGPGVVTGRYGTIGEVFYVDGPYWPLNTTLYVSDFRGNDPRWVYHLLAALPLTIDAEKSAVTGINRNVVGQLRAVRPPLPEQRRIAADLDDHARAVSEATTALERQVDLLVERRHALITAAVTGQLKIPGVAA